MNDTMSTQPARGMRDFLPEELRRRDYVVGVVRNVYERYGFEPLETPAVENIDTLLGKYGEEGNKLIFKILKRGEHESSGQADLALRYDLTVPLARVVAEYQVTLPRFFKRYQIQPVWRADRPARGRFREFYQCDIDIVGSTSLVVEAELCAAVGDVLTRLGFQNFTIRINHRAFLTATLECAGIPPGLHADALITLDKLDKIGPAGVLQELATRGIEAAAATKCLSFFGEGNSEETATRIEQAAKFVSGHQMGQQAVTQLRDLFRLLDGTRAGGRVRFDPSLARGLSYYTGAIMEINVPDLAGSLGGGGRYDNLIGMFLGRDVPACGFSLGLERILVVMGERNMFPESVVDAPSDVMVTLWNEGTCADALALAATLRADGLRVDVYPEVDKIGKQFKYASSRHVPFVTVVGDDEQARGEVTIKDMRSGEQKSLRRDDVAMFIKNALSS